MPPPDAIAALLARDIAAITRQLIAGGAVETWERAMLEAITRGHAAAAIAGEAERGIIGRGRAALAKWIGERALSAATRQLIRDAVAGQAPYLRNFASELGQLSDAQIAARAALYAGATRASYSKARWAGRGLPAYPADGGTACLVNCKCAWVERDDGMYWELGAAEHCADCESRASQWRPWRE
jgi:hypothetical protein